MKTQLASVLDLIADQMSDQGRAYVFEKLSAVPAKRARTKVGRNDFENKVLGFVIPPPPRPSDD